MKKPFFSIVTPVFNGEIFLEETIKSVLDQDFKNFEYIIIDGDSKDNTKNIIDKYKHNLAYYKSEKDNGMYDALSKGFKLCSGKYFLWINSDDFLNDRKVLSNLNKYLLKFPNIDWLVGKPSYKLNSFKNKISFIPYHYPKWIIKNGFAFNCAWGCIQQESTIFSKKLYDLAGGIDLNYKMAGDFFLWKKFSNFSKLSIANIKIGVHRKWSGQLQGGQHYYYQEIKRKKCFFPFMKIFRLLFSIMLYPITYYKK